MNPIVVPVGNGGTVKIYLLSDGVTAYKIEYYPAGSSTPSATIDGDVLNVRWTVNDALVLIWLYAGLPGSPPTL